jgi:hypothetical protein
MWHAWRPGPTVGLMHQDRPFPDTAQRPAMTRHDDLNWVMICRADSWLISSMLGGATIDATSSSSCCLLGDTEPEARRFGDWELVRPFRVRRKGIAAILGSDDGFFGGKYRGSGRRVGRPICVAHWAGAKNKYFRYDTGTAGAGCWRDWLTL